MSLMMSISGVRGIVGETMTPELAAELGLAFGAHVGGGMVVVGRDSRPSGAFVQRAVVSGLLASGCEVIDLGMVTTPGVALMTVRHGAAGGVVVTASHNPIEWNGIKFLSPRGYAFPADEARQILDRYEQKQFSRVEVGRLRGERHDDSTHERHVAAVLAAVDAEGIRRRGFRVVLDSVNGAGGPGGRRLLEALGCTVVPINGEPTGRFVHPPEPVVEHLAGLCEAVRSERADVGFAQDPDADRLAIVDEGGRYIGEEYSLALAALRVFARRPGCAATNLSTSRMIDDLAARAGGACRVVRTPVGEAHVARAMVTHGCVVGGEGNGGVILPEVVMVRDSFAGMAIVLELLAAEGRPLSDVVAGMPRYAMVKRKFDADGRRVAEWIGRIRTELRDGKMDEADGVRIDWPEGWVHVRPSNTEPIARVIAEAKDAANAAGLVERVVGLMK